MIYLSGVTSDRDEPFLIANGIGLMAQPRSGYDKRVPRYAQWGADNGCFSDRWEEDHWMRWLDALPRERCLFAVAPDVYPDAAATLERSTLYFDLIRTMGFPVALVAQNGAEHLDLPWDDFDCLFIGGERTPDPRKEWKVGPAAEGLCRRARREGKWVHCGRVNSLERLARVREMGCLSADGTYIKYRRRKRAGETEVPTARGVEEIGVWHQWLRDNPCSRIFEAPALPVHRAAANLS